MTISIEKGKTLTIKLLAVGPLNTEKGTRECFFELNGEVSCSYRDSVQVSTDVTQSRAVVIEDKNAAIEHVSREKASSDPGSVGSPMVRFHAMTYTFSCSSWCSLVWSSTFG